MRDFEAAEEGYTVFIRYSSVKGEKKSQPGESIRSHSHINNFKQTSRMTITTKTYTLPSIEGEQISRTR
jgi:hypothetical protein